jgi:N-acyl-L-homoserine lactone synthetase
MIDAITFETAHLLGDALPSMYRFRHRVFVERQNYDVPNHNGMEWDQFDTPAAAYLLWRDDERQVRGMFRLIPTTFPYMIKEVWPQLVNCGELPSHPDVWETSRFGVDRDLPPSVRKRIFGELMCASTEYGLANGVHEYVTLTAPALFRSGISHSGCAVTYLGARQKLVGLPVVVGKWSVSQDTLTNMRRYHGIDGPVLRIAEESQARAA